MTKIKKFVIRNSAFVIIFMLLIMPVVSFAAVGDPLVPCNNTPDANGVIAQPCNFNALMTLVNTVIHFALFYMAVPIAAIMFVYAGFELVSSGGSTEKRGIAKKVFTNAVIGLVLAAAAWLIIRTVLSILGYNGAWIGF
jgi:hypothetical protein